MKSFLFYLCITIVMTSFIADVTRATNITLDSNTTLDSSSIADYTIIDGANPPTVVEVNEGAILENSGRFGEANFLVFDSSILNINGGVIQATGQSDISINAVDESEVNLFDGSIHGNAEAFVISGNSTLNIHGGIITADTKTIDSFGQSTVNIHDGEFLAPGRFAGNSIVNIFDGGFTEGGIEIFDSASVNIFGGRFESTDFPLFVAGENELNIRGGEFVFGEETRGIAIGDLASVNIFGIGLDITDNLLTGILADGSSINAKLILGENPNITLHTVPEPSTLLLALFALCCKIIYLLKRLSRLGVTGS